MNVSCFFLFKQKTAYEMRSSDWSSDVCSSDLHIASFKDKGKCDFIRDFAFPFPVSIFLDLIDLPHEDTARFMTWEHDLLHESDLDTVGNAVRNVTGYMREVIADRRRNPRDDFISYGIQAEIRGRPLTDDRSEQRRGGKKWCPK